MILFLYMSYFYCFFSDFVQIFIILDFQCMAFVKWLCTHVLIYDWVWLGDVHQCCGCSHTHRRDFTIYSMSHVWIKLMPLYLMKSQPGLRNIVLPFKWINVHIVNCEFDMMFQVPYTKLCSCLEKSKHFYPPCDFNNFLNYHPVPACH